MRYVAIGAEVVGAFVAVLCGCDPAAPQRAAPSATEKSAAPVASTSVAPAVASAVPSAASSAKGPFSQSTHEAMLAPAKANAQAPETFKAKFETTAGDIVLLCTRSWAPHGVDRFYNLINIGFYDDVAIFRVAPGFVVQWGIHGNPDVTKAWLAAPIEADEARESNLLGTVSFAQDGDPVGKGKTPGNRSTQVFVNLADNDHLDAQGFAPICQVVSGMEVTGKLGGSQYHEHLKREQGNIQLHGNKLLRNSYPELDYIVRARLVEDEPAPPSSAAPSAHPPVPKTAPNEGI